jgi:hypothetical protein
MEKKFNSKNYILKNPRFISEHFDKLIQSNVSIKLMIIPIRDYEESAESRRKLGPGVRGGLWNATDKNTQLLYYYKIMASYLYYMTKYEINTLFINFDKMITNPIYLFNKLKPILDEKNITLEEFINVYNECSKIS